VQKSANALRSALGLVRGGVALINDYLGYANQFIELTNLAGQVMSGSANAVASIMDSAADVTKSAINSATSVTEGVSAIVSLPQTIQLKAQNLGIDAQNEAEKCAQAAKKIAEAWRSSKKLESEEQSEGIAIQSESIECDSLIELEINELENVAYMYVIRAMSSEIPTMHVGSPDPATGIPNIILSYGYIPVVINATDTLESLAAEYLESPDRAIDIATFNGIVSLSERNPGDIVKIPITTRTEKMESNQIFARREDKDNYGRDILLDDDGCIVASNTGDFALACGAENLSQAILLRLRESNAKRIRRTAYGIRTNVNDTAAGTAFILSSIDQTIKSDPRVASVEGIRFRGERDCLYVDVFYTDINNSLGEARGRI
jgi:hypothetical protein